MGNRPMRKLDIPRRFVMIALSFCLIGIPATARAANNCPWLNEATASGLLGGDAIGAYTVAPGQPSVCTFTQQNQDVTRSLVVAVEIAQAPHARMVTIAQTCGANAVPLNAIGNEAISCAPVERKGELRERVIGRVRDQVFIITLASSLKNDPILTRDALKTRSQTAAEQVSGNLF
jgi:hypothetical protein